MAIAQKDATKETAKMINRGMKVIADIAKIYKKYGKSAVWTPIAPTHHEPKRRLRLAQKAVPVGVGMCGTCHKLFVAKTSERCSCKATVKTKRHKG